MPSVEIICVGQRKPLLFKHLPFRVYAENRLVSHRTPSPLFQPDFEKMKGCIYHLCSPPRGAYTAADLLRECWDGYIAFKPKYLRMVRSLFLTLLRASPEHRIIFTSDFQFGPGALRYKRPVKMHQFWRLHRIKQIPMNALFHVHL